MKSGIISTASRFFLSTDGASRGEAEFIQTFPSQHPSDHHCGVYQSKYEVFEEISVYLSEGHAVGVELFYEACHVAVCFLGLLRDVFFLA